jgi:hypothetical protein
MGIPEEFQKLIRKGDASLIAELYAERHAHGENPDYKTVSIQYVQMVLLGIRSASPGTAAEEIEAIAIKLLEHRRNFISLIV